MNYKVYAALFAASAIALAACGEKKSSQAEAPVSTEAAATEPMAETPPATDAMPADAALTGDVPAPDAVVPEAAPAAEEPATK